MHTDHIKLEGTWESEIGNQFNTTILSELGGKLPFCRPFSVCLGTSRSTYFVFVFFNCVAGKLSGYKLVISLLQFFSLFEKFKNKREK